MKGTSGPAQLQGHARVNSINYFGATKALNDSLRPEFHAFIQDPDTASPWTHAGVNAAQFGVKSIT